MQPRLEKTKLSEAQVHHNRVEFLKTRIANLRIELDLLTSGNSRSKEYYIEKHKHELALREKELERKQEIHPPQKREALKKQ